MLELFALVVFLCAAGSMISFLRNALEFRTAPQAEDDVDLPPVSVLIPARNEQDGIRNTLDAVLANQRVAFEVIVFSDQSTDATEEIVNDVAASDPRVRLVRGEGLPDGWCGKQHACFQLAQHAQHDDLLFIDADVTLRSDAICRSLLQRRVCSARLLSAFPRQIVGSLGESLLLPLIQIVLLTYLPFRQMRTTLRPAASAGCGQLFLTDRHAYEQSGGHGAIKASLHDGVTLPRAYRRAGLSTDVFDGSDLCACRMYRGWSQTVQGLMKNAHEGVANHRLIVPATSLLVLGYLAPTLLVIHQAVWPHSSIVVLLSISAAVISYIPRFVAAARFDGAWFSALLFPFSILLFVVVQWVAYMRSLVGARSSWRGRSYSSDPSVHDEVSGQATDAASTADLVDTRRP